MPQKSPAPLARSSPSLFPPKHADPDARGFWAKLPRAVASLRRQKRLPWRYKHGSECPSVQTKPPRSDRRLPAQEHRLHRPHRASHENRLPSQYLQERLSQSLPVHGKPHQDVYKRQVQNIASRISDMGGMVCSSVSGLFVKPSSLLYFGLPGDLCRGECLFSSHHKPLHRPETAHAAPLHHVHLSLIHI